MVSNQILQQSIEGIKGISRVDLCVTDAEGKTIASTMSSSVNFQAQVREFVKSSADSQEIQSSQYFKIYDEQALEYIVICASNGDNSYLVGKMAAFQIQSLAVAYKPPALQPPSCPHIRIRQETSHSSRCIEGCYSD